MKILLLLLLLVGSAQAREVKFPVETLRHMAVGLVPVNKVENGYAYLEEHVLDKIVEDYVRHVRKILEKQAKKTEKGYNKKEYTVEDDAGAGREYHIKEVWYTRTQLKSIYYNPRAENKKK